MFRRRNPKARRAFTLLEMIIALMVTAMIVLTLYRFVSSHLAVIRTSMELGDERESLDAVVNLVQGQLDALPTLQNGNITGKAYKFHNLSNDEMTWTASPGPGLLTTAAKGEFEVTLTVQPVDTKSSETELGLRRRPTATNQSSLELTRGGAGGHYDWRPLIRPMAALEIRYFDPASHSWVDKWSADQPPALVRLRMQKYPDQAFMEAVLSIHSNPSQQGMPSSPTLGRGLQQIPSNVTPAPPQ